MRFYWLEFCPSLSASRLDILSDLNGLERKREREKAGKWKTSFLQSELRLALARIPAAFVSTRRTSQLVQQVVDHLSSERISIKSVFPFIQFYYKAKLELSSAVFTLPCLVLNALSLRITAVC
jgi:hypothetical protein